MSATIVNTRPNPASSPAAPLLSPSSEAQPLISIVADQALHPTVVKGNADFTLTPQRTAVYVGIDTVGGLRQTGAATESIALLAHAPAVAGVASAATPLGLLITGPLCALTAVGWTIPDAYGALKKAREELRVAPSAETAEAVQVAELGLANHGLYLAMGLTQTASGITTLCSTPAANVFHYTPVLTGKAATTAATVTGVALGAIYVARGGIMLTRAVKSYLLANDFHMQLANNAQSLDAAIAFMKQAEEQGHAYMDRRVDPSCLEGVNATSVQGLSPEEQVAYLARVDKGIYTEELKHKVAMVIASAMIVGGILAILLSALFTGGLSLALVGLISAVFFMSMEYIFITYDSSSVFESLRDKLYAKPAWLANLEKGLAP